MLYKYNPESIKFEPILLRKYVPYLVIFFIPYLIVLGAFFYPENEIEKNEDIYYENKLIVLNEFNSFSEEKLIKYIKQLNFKYPHIVLAQSRLETGHYKSLIFKENNNLFGLKEAKSRIKTAKGTRKSHAYYDHWTESLIDYALYSATYLSRIKNEEQYFDYLKQNYAEDTLYVNKLQHIIEKEKLKLLFE
jgi:uncharacterized FlgJ-related protein